MNTREKQRQQDVRKVHELINTSAQKQVAEAKGKLRGVFKKLRRREEENEELKQELEQLRASAILHPDGRCTCCGEGTCQFCRLMQAKTYLEEIKELQRYEAYSDHIGVHMEKDDEGLYIKSEDLDKVLE